MKDPFKKDGPENSVPQAGLIAKRVLRSEEIFLKEREVIIIHGELQYRLQITKAGKLILNK